MVRLMWPGCNANLATTLLGPTCQLEETSRTELEKQRVSQTHRQRMGLCLHDFLCWCEFRDLVFDANQPQVRSRLWYEWKAQEALLGAAYTISRMWQLTDPSMLMYMQSEVECVGCPVGYNGTPFATYVFGS